MQIISFECQTRFKFYQPCRNVHAAIDDGQDNDSPFPIVADEKMFLHTVEVESG